MDIELTTSVVLTREEVAARLHAIADDLARHNAMTIVRYGRRAVVDVPDDVEFNVECELGDESEIEIEISWPTG